MMQILIDQWATGVGILHFVLALLLFFITNWIGKHSYSIGYVDISLYVQDEDAPAFNFIIRVFTPIVYLIVTSATLYQLGLDRFVSGYYMVSMYYIMVRLTVNIAQGRAQLINWPRQFMYYASILILSWVVYTKFLLTKTNILPDLSNIANEMWIIIFLFVYKIINELNFDSSASEGRKQRYLASNYRNFRGLYGAIIDKELTNDVLKAVVYAIIIYENFNRSRTVRWLENISFLLTQKPHSLGVMQFPTERFIDDKQSVALGTQKVRKSYEAVVANYTPAEDDYYDESLIYNPIISKYNGGSAYQQAVGDLVIRILAKFYANTSDTLNPASMTKRVQPLVPSSPLGLE